MCASQTDDHVARCECEYCLAREKKRKIGYEKKMQSICFVFLVMMIGRVNKCKRENSYVKKYEEITKIKICNNNNNNNKVNICVGNVAVLLKHEHTGTCINSRKFVISNFHERRIVCNKLNFIK